MVRAILLSAVRFTSVEGKGNIMRKKRKPPRKDILCRALGDESRPCQFFLPCAFPIASIVRDPCVSLSFVDVEAEAVGVLPRARFSIRNLPGSLGLYGTAAKSRSSASRSQGAFNCWEARRICASSRYALKERGGLQFTPGVTTVTKVQTSPPRQASQRKRMK